MFEYKRGVTTFSVYRATGEDPGAGEYHARAQCLAPWFIEGEHAERSEPREDPGPFLWKQA